MEVKIVLGLLWGDEGKGNTVQWLCKKAIDDGKRPCVVRFSGGPQSGHTVVNDGITHVCSSYGSGVLLGVPTLYLNSTFVDPLCIFNEKEELAAKGIENPIIDFNPGCPVITPYDVMDQQEWAAKNGNYTCGKGIWSALQRNRHGIIFDFSDLFSHNMRNLNLGCVKSYYGGHFEPSGQILNKWRYAAKQIYDSWNLNKHKTNYDVLIFEGTQGLLLDAENGFLPHVTSTKVGLNGIPESYLPDAEVYLVTRSYLTRHGKMGKFEESNFFSARIDIPPGKLETNVNNKYQGEFRTAYMNENAITAAAQRHRLDNYASTYGCRFNLVVTHYDIEQIPLTCPFIALNNVGIDIDKVFVSRDPESNLELTLERVDNDKY